MASQFTLEKPSELENIGVSEGSALIARKQLSPVEWTLALLDRIARLDGCVNAFVNVVADRALNQARQAEHDIAAGRRRGPLHGVPFALKDMFDTAGIATTGQSRVASNRIPSADAAAAGALYEAGGILIGKLATHEFAHGGPSLDLPWPPARNPWNLDHFAGSSSSGSGVAVAAGFVPAALGTDTGGSIRIPAALCGIAGLKPTYGLVSRRGVLPLAPSLDTCGPMARTSRDCALLLQAIARHDPDDPTSARTVVPDYAAALTGNLRGLHIGVVRHFWESDLMVDPEAVAAIEAALQVLRDRGAKLLDVTLRPLREYNDVRIMVQQPEAFAIFQTTLATRAGEFGRDFLGRILPGCLIAAHVQVQASRQRRRMTEEMRAALGHCDALVTMGPGPAPRFDAECTHGFKFGLWSDRPNLTSPFSVTGFPALSVCSGFSASGLPLSMQVVGRPFEEHTVLRIGDAYEAATLWHARRADLQEDCAPSPIILAPDPPAPANDQRIAAWIECCFEQAGLTLTDDQLEMVHAVAPQVRAIMSRIRLESEWLIEPSTVFRV